MVNESKFNSNTGASGGARSTRLGVRNTSKSVQIKKSILKALNENRNSISDLLRTTLQTNPVMGLEMTIQLAALVLDKDKY